MKDNQKKEIESICNKYEEKIKWDEPMKKHTTFKIGGNAECYITVTNVELLKKLIQYAKQEELPITIIGNGSNILVLDNGIQGLTLKIEIQEIKIENDNITIGAGNKLISTAYKLAEQGYTGLEELSGIPGTIGGATYMNAGANGKEIKDVLEEIECMNIDGEIVTIKKENANFQYRDSMFSNKKYIILKITIKLEKGNIEEIKNKIEFFNKKRKETQPIEHPSAGSSFKRGDGFITAELIDKCELKGYKIGGAEISRKHAGFIINSGNATAQDVIKLANYVKEKIYEKYNKKIELEIEILGE